MAAMKREREGEKEEVLQAAEWEWVLKNVSSDALFVRLPLGHEGLQEMGNKELEESVMR